MRPSPIRLIIGPVQTGVYHYAVETHSERRKICGVSYVGKGLNLSLPGLFVCRISELAKESSRNLAHRSLLNSIANDCSFVYDFTWLSDESVNKYLQHFNFVCKHLIRRYYDKPSSRNFDFCPSFVAITNSLSAYDRFLMRFQFLIFGLIGFYISYRIFILFYDLCYYLSHLSFENNFKYSSFKYDDSFNVKTNFTNFVKHVQRTNPHHYVTDDPKLAFNMLTCGYSVLFIVVELNSLNDDSLKFMKKIGPTGIEVSRKTTLLSDVSVFPLYDFVNTNFLVPYSKRKFKFIEFSDFTYHADCYVSGLNYFIETKKYLDINSDFDINFVSLYSMQPVSLVCDNNRFNLLRRLLSFVAGYPCRDLSLSDNPVNSIFLDNNSIMLSPSAAAKVEGDVVKIKYLPSSKVYSVPLDLFMNAWTKYSLAKDTSYGVITATLGKSVDETQATLVTTILMANVKTSLSRFVLPDLTFQPLFAGVDTFDSKPMNIGVISNPVYLNDGFPYGVPKSGRNTEFDTFNKRLIAPSNHKDINSKYYVYASDFVKQLTPTVLVPVETYEVCEQMNRPSQKRNRDEVMLNIDSLPTGPKDLFLKREPVAQNKPARNICTVSPNRLYTMARYTIAASRWMKANCPWWVWGIGSGETSRKFSSVASEYPEFIESDFSKFDASLPLFFTSINEMLMRGWFPDHFDIIKEQLDDVFYQEVKSSKGIRFNYGHGRFTGENNTALFNTIDQCFVQYASLRDIGKDHKQAYDIICKGLYGGDDGITPYVKQDLTATSTALGMVVDVRIVDNMTPCRFLGRVYPCPAKSSDSYQDLSSFIKTIHMVNKADDLDPIIGLLNVVKGLSVTDRNTPLIKEFIESVYRAYPNRTGSIASFDMWWYKHYDESDPFTLSDFNDVDIIFSFTALNLECEVSDIYSLRDWFLNNDFVIGSTLPLISNSKPIKFTGCLEIGGVPIGTITDPPVMPKFSKSEITAFNDAACMGVDIISSCVEDVVVKDKLLSLDMPMSNVNVLNTDLVNNLLHQSDIRCLVCGLDYHKTEDCPYKVKCRLCDKFGHLAKNCTIEEEAELLNSDLFNVTNKIANISDKVLNKNINKSKQPKRRYRKRE